MNKFASSIVVALFLCISSAQFGVTTRISTTAIGREMYEESTAPKVSTNGTFVLFKSRAPETVPGGKRTRNIYVRNTLTGSIEQISLNYDGSQPNGPSGDSDMTPDGRYVVFANSFGQILPGLIGQEHLYRKDRLTGEVVLVSVAHTGESFGGCRYPNISDDGRYVSFYTSAANVVPGDTNGWADIFVRDMDRGINELATLRSDGGQTTLDPFMRHAMSGDGSAVVFYSGDNLLVPGDTNQSIDVFVRDRNAGTTTRVSVASNGTQGNDASYSWSISSNGRLVAFYSASNTLVPGDTNANSDVFLRDRIVGTTTRVSVGPGGVQGNGGSFEPVMSDDGTKIVFGSSASNLGPLDVNGMADIFMRDQASGNVTIVSNSTAGSQLNEYIVDKGVDPTGRFVVFSTNSARPVPNDSNNFEDVFLHDTLGGRISPTGFSMVVGSGQGSLSQLLASDNSSLECTPEESEPGLPQVQLIVQGLSPISNPVAMEIYLETSTLAPSITTYIYLFDFSAGSYKRVEVRTARTTDSYWIAQVPEGGRYVGPNGLIRAKIDFYDPWPNFGPAWTAKIDHVMWSVRPPS